MAALGREMVWPAARDALGRLASAWLVRPRLARAAEREGDRTPSNALFFALPALLPGLLCSAWRAWPFACRCSAARGLLAWASRGLSRRSQAWRAAPGL